MDHAGHYLHFRDGEMKRGVLRLLGSNSVFVRRSSWVYLYGKLTPYPFQANIHGHNPALIRECISGLVRVRASAKAAPARENYLEWMVRTFGTGFTRHFLAPFNRKQFRTPLEELTPLQGGRFVPRPRIEDVVRGAMTPEPPRLGYNAAFWHPRRGGIEVLARALARRVRRILRTGVALRKVHARKRVAEMSDGTRVPYGILVSTVPLPALLRMLGPDATGASGLAGALRHIGVLCVHFLVRNPREKVRHWIYVPERRIGFYRVGFPANVTPADAPPGTGIVSAEVSYLPGAARRRPASGWPPSALRGLPAGRRSPGARHGQGRQKSLPPCRGWAGRA